MKLRITEFNSSNNLIKINPCSLVFIQLSSDKHINLLFSNKKNKLS